MYIDESVLRDYLEDPKKFEALCKQKKEIMGWWDKTEGAIQRLCEMQINSELCYYKNKTQEGNREDVRQFYQSYVDANGEESKQIFHDYAFLMGGLEFNGEQTRALNPKIMKISCGTGNIDCRNSRKNTFDYLTNNHPDNLIALLSKINGASFCTESIFDFSKIVASDPWDILKGNKDKTLRDQICQGQSVILDDFKKNNYTTLQKSFSLKFFWMWKNQNEVIHPLSLMAFKEFLKSKFMEDIFKNNIEDLQKLVYDSQNKLGVDCCNYAQNITNANFENFLTIWQVVSKAIMTELCGHEWDSTTIENGREKTMKQANLERVSKLISLLTLGETDMANIDELLKTHKQIILYGVPGTGKTHSAKELVGKWSGENIQNFSELKKWQFSEIVKEKHDLNCEKQDCKICHDINNSPIIWEIMQFHPNTTYQDFIGGITPKIDKETLLYELKDGKFKKFCEYANKYGTIEGVGERPFVFIIDEINRANLSEVLGELLYALEYRDEKITIPNFKESFVIPSNVYIIGTMNNVDKSLSTFDLALRRRFGFYEIGVDCDVIWEMLKNKTINNIKNIKDYIERCRDLNMLISGEIDGDNQKRLKTCPKLDLEKHYQIGQAYFAKIEKFLQDEEEINPRHLGKLWDYHLQPLLEEYIGFSMSDKDISNKLKNMKDFWTKKLSENEE